jgi:hypothetical protein
LPPGILSRLENLLQISYNIFVVDSLLTLQNRHVGQVKFRVGFVPEAKNYFAWKVMSLRHVSLREMGWSRKPYEFRSPLRSKSKGEATYAAFRKHAFLASKCFGPILVSNAAVSLCGVFADLVFAKANRLRIC